MVMKKVKRHCWLSIFSKSNKKAVSIGFDKVIKGPLLKPVLENLTNFNYLILIING